MTETYDMAEAAEEDARRARLLNRLLASMGVVAILGAASSFVDDRNDVRVTAAFYSVVAVGLLGVAVLVRRGLIKAAAWILNIFLWLLVAAVTVFFGGMEGGNASVFAVTILLLGTTVGGRAAVGAAIATSLWCALLVWLELHHALPKPLVEYSPINAWTSLAVTLILTSVLLRSSLRSLEKMHARERASARQRDEALRRSIQAQKMELVGNVTSGIAHDFNNLLTVMGGVSDILRDPQLDPAERQGLLDDLDDATSRAKLMTSQLLSFGRTPVTDLKPVDLSAVVHALSRMLPRLLGSTIQVEVHTAPGAWVRASHAGLEQVLLNLAVNARDAMPRGGRLEIRVTVEEQAVVLTARDTGVGMDAATRERIFEPFFSTKAAGTGLGLATVRELVTSFGAAISVLSEPGQGATFEVRFQKLADPAVAAGTARAQHAAPRVSGRLLLVEDDQLVRRSVARWLDLDGFEVVAVANGQEALSVLASASGITCVVSDIAMPCLDGEELAAVLAEKFPSLPLVLMSGNRTPAAHLLEGPTRTFLPKPLDRSSLRGAIARVTA